jgi:hypothetical protein
VGVRILWTLAILLTLAGCAAPASTSSAPPPTEAVVGIDDLRFTCGKFPFSADILLAPARNDEDAPTPAAEALRNQLAQPGPDIDFLPDHGWTLAGADGRLAEFVLRGGDLGMKSVSVENQGGQWRVTGWGDCRPTIDLANGLGAADWAWGGPGLPDPRTTTFTALVTERACAGGKSAEGRIVGPQIVRGDDIVLIMFAVRQLPGAQTCQSNPSTPVAVDLGEPLGDRVLRDGGQLPFADPLQPRQ